MKVLVCGGRDFNDQDLVFQILDSLHENASFTHVIHGGARGADAHAGLWAGSRGVQEVACPANWNLLGKSAGVRRNISMLQLLNPGDGVVVAFPGGKGTQDMKDRARQKGVTVYEPSALD